MYSARSRCAGFGRPPISGGGEHAAVRVAHRPCARERGEVRGALSLAAHADDVGHPAQHHGAEQHRGERAGDKREGLALLGGWAGAVARRAASRSPCHRATARLQHLRKKCVTELRAHLRPSTAIHDPVRTPAATHPLKENPRCHRPIPRSHRRRRRRPRLGSAAGRGTDPTATSVARMRCDATMHRRLTIVLLAAAASLALLAALPAGAGAQSGGSRFPTVLLSAKTTQGRFQGSFVIRRFRVRAPGLAVFGRLNGRLRDRRYPSAQRVRNSPFSFTVALARVPVAELRAHRDQLRAAHRAARRARRRVRAADADPAPAPRDRLVDGRAALRRLRRGRRERAAGGDGAPAQRPPPPVRVMVDAGPSSRVLGRRRRGARPPSPRRARPRRSPRRRRCPRRATARAAATCSTGRGCSGSTAATAARAGTGSGAARPRAGPRSRCRTRGTRTTGAPSGFIGAPAWYRKDFRLPSRARSLDWRVHFDSVNYRATVWLNGRLVGRHAGGFIAFTLPLAGLQAARRQSSRRPHRQPPPADRLPADDVHAHERAARRMVELRRDRPRGLSASASTGSTSSGSSCGRPFRVRPARSLSG